jgi:hypothetical protein
MTGNHLLLIYVSVPIAWYSYWVIWYIFFSPENFSGFKSEKLELINFAIVFWPLTLSLIPPLAMVNVLYLICYGMRNLRIMLSKKGR